MADKNVNVTHQELPVLVRALRHEDARLSDLQHAHEGEKDWPAWQETYDARVSIMRLLRRFNAQ